MKLQVGKQTIRIQTYHIVTKQEDRNRNKKKKLEDKDDK